MTTHHSIHDEISSLEAKLRAMETTVDPSPEGWPVMPDQAYQGVIGEYVCAIAPYTEADPAAIHVQGLTAYGNVIGRTAHVNIEATAHAGKINAVVVGDTSNGRKGTAWDHVRALFAAAAISWASSQITSGLSSGEGLVSAVRDPTFKKERVKERGQPDRYDDIMIDPGIDDKRALVVESEFGRTLGVKGREGNTLSAMLRQAWDQENLRVMTKSSLQATGAHISVIGHITPGELHHLLNGVDAINGFWNRFLWVLSHRTKFLPAGRPIDPALMTPFVERLQRAIAFGQQAGELRRDDAAEELWTDVYPILAERDANLVGAITSRAPAYVMRLALLYALQDFSGVIRPIHLRAALAVWQYCEDSARHIFGDRLGDVTADTILRAVREHPSGVSRADINSNYFSRHLPGADLSEALAQLLERKLIHCKTRRTGGRGAEIYFAGPQSMSDEEGTAA